TTNRFRITVAQSFRAARRPLGRPEGLRYRSPLVPSPQSPPTSPSLVTTLRRMHFLELQLLFVEHRLAADAGELPRGDVRIILVVAQRFAVGRLALLAEVAAARFAAVQRVEGEQLGELEVVADAAGVLEAL